MAQYKKDIGFSNVSDLTGVRNGLMQLDEKLNYLFQYLGKENFTPEAWEALTKWKNSSGMLAAYPVGSIYMSVSATSPATLFGGTWVQIKGRFLLGTGKNEANTTDYYGAQIAGELNQPVNERGGQVNHQLTIDEMPSHNHPVKSNNGINVDMNGSWTSGSATAAINGSTLANQLVTTNVGAGYYHNNMPPYLVVYMWQRTE